ncbi:DMT family transporter [Mesobaculum littorinae]|uniref:DMT family transporter n=1 Tax=Mesobaculum littorinae TaxID=2486419 RepID=A0A438AID6_9RHOB|nr:DMT family transporter [Mesobaculum littorinae]RVV98398.1 DMT family transporter [Mesobaculum littorinae]
MTDLGQANLRGASLALLAFALFSTHDVAVKYLGGLYSPFQIIFFSVLLSFPLATLMLMRDPTRGHLRPVHPWWTGLRTIMGVVTGMSAFYAFSVLPLAQTYAILFASPLLITLLSIPILGEKVGPHRLGAVIAGLIGVMVVLRPGAQEMQLGHFAAMAAAVGSAMAGVIVRKIGKDERSAVLMLYPMMANAVVMSCLLPFVYKPMPLADLGLTGMLAAFSFTAGLLVISAYRAAEAAIVAPMQYSQIIWAALFGAVFFDEVPDPMTWVGAAIIIVSGLYIVIRESRGGASANMPVIATRSRPDTGTYPRPPALKSLPGRGSRKGLQMRRQADT